MYKFKFIYMKQKYTFLRSQIKTYALNLQGITAFEEKDGKEMGVGEGQKRINIHIKNIQEKTLVLENNVDVS